MHGCLEHDVVWRHWTWRREKTSSLVWRAAQNLSSPTWDFNPTLSIRIAASALDCRWMWLMLDGAEPVLTKALHSALLVVACLGGEQLVTAWGSLRAGDLKPDTHAVWVIWFPYVKTSFSNCRCLLDIVDCRHFDILTWRKGWLSWVEAEGKIFL